MCAPDQNIFSLHVVILMLCVNVYYCLASLKLKNKQTIETVKSDLDSLEKRSERLAFKMYAEREALRKLRELTQAFSQTSNHC